MLITTGSRLSIRSRSPRASFPDRPCFASHMTDFSYQDNQHGQYGPLRVINEDRVEPKTGFGTHSHREFEIFSYVVSGTLEQ